MTYEELVEIAQHDDRIVGLVLTGSRGREFAVGDASDWDVRLVVRDDVLDEYRERFGTPHGSTVEVVVLSLSELEDVGVRGSDTAWDRYSYVAATLAVDDVGDSLSRVLDRLGSLDRNEARQLAAERLDDYVNAYYRAAKNAQAGLADEARLDARESVPLCLDFLFAVNERVRPFNRFLRWELDRRPLPGAAWSAGALLMRLEAVAAADLPEQRRLFRDVEALARAHGLGDVVDAWEPDVAWLRDT